MFTAQELKQLPLFESVPPEILEKLAGKTADVRLCEGEWLIREGETPYFYVIVEGAVEVVKEINGREELLKEFKAPDFFGEVPIFMGAPSLASVQAKVPSRILPVGLGCDHGNEQVHFGGIRRSSVKCLDAGGERSAYCRWS